MPAHVMLEAYSVLTRLPAGLAIPAATAAEVLAKRFADEPFRVPDAERAGLVRKLADAGVFGGASYDGLVALEATAHEHTLLTLDERAKDTYRRLGAPFRVIE